MKKITLLSWLVFLSAATQAQVQHTGGNYVAGDYVGYDASNGANPLRFITNATNRFKVNGNLSYTINGFTDVRNGYMLLSPLQNPALSIQTGNMFDPNRGAYSILHLHGTGTAQEAGVRPWWKTGITLTDNLDASYFGLRQVGTGTDVTETVINWTDNQGGPPWGYDDMVFRFTSAGDNQATGAAYSSNLWATDDLDGLHIARFSALGYFGLGNTFGVNAAGTGTNYVIPQSLLHMSYDRINGYDSYGFMQVTYRDDNNPTAIGIGEAATDGLRIGIDNVLTSPANGQPHLNGLLRWQEASSFVTQTGDGTNTIDNGERMRVTSAGALALNYGSEYLGLTGPTLTRIGISHNGHSSLKLTKPMSTLHIGYNLGNATSAAGWRQWMDLGALVSNSTDNMYVGLKPRTATASLNNDNMDAVLAWGDNGTSATNPDVMRFIFTASPTNSADQSAATTADGLEMMRIVPGLDVSCPTNSQYDNQGDAASYGRVGIGDFTATGVNGQPTHKLDVIGNARLRLLPDNLYEADAAVTKYVMVDNTGVLRWTDTPVGLSCWDLNGNGLQDQAEDVNNDGDWNALDCQGQTGATGATGATGPQGPQGPQGPAGTGGGAAGAHNGTSMSTIDNTKVAFGQNVGELNNPGELLSHREVPMNDKDIYFTNPAPNALARNRVAFGTTSPTAKVHVVENSININSTGFIVENHATGSGTIATGERIQVDNANDINYGERVTVSGGTSYNNGATYDVIGAANAVGITSDVRNGSVNNVGLRSYAFMDNSQTSGTNTGVQALGAGAATNYGGHFTAINNTGASTTYQNAVRAYALGTSGTNVGVEAYADGATNSYGIIATGGSGTVTYAGYFNGPVTVTGTFTEPSDRNLKENIQPLKSGMDIVNKLQPKTYLFDQDKYPSMHLASDLQYGLIAQEVETVLPELVTQNLHPAVYDAEGKVVTPAISFKGLEYTQLIPVMLKGMQEQDAELNAKDATIAAQQAKIDDLNSRLTQLENCLSGILPYLCQLSQSAVEANTPVEQEAIRAQLSVKLSNREAIILDQNVPNPFAEQTVINFSIPESVQKAQIHFYDGNGKLLQSVEVAERGLGSLTVFGSDLSRGAYTYTLIADGQQVATKKMVKQ